MDASLAAQFRANISGYVARLEAVQSELLTHYRRKRTALAAANVADLESLLSPETDLAKRLTLLRDERQQFLVRAGQLGAPNRSLAELVTALGGEMMNLESRIAQCSRRAADLRREGWVHWVVAHRSVAHTSSLLDLIAHRGDRPPTYDGAATSGGTLLDTSA